MEYKKSNLLTRRKALQLLGSSAMATFIPLQLNSRQLQGISIDTEEINKRIYCAYRSFWPELKTTATFKNLGINTRCFFASNTINSIGNEYCKYPLIWERFGKYNFSAFTEQVEDLLSANPEAEFMCMIDLNTPYWLTRQLAYDSFAVISHAASDQKWLDITTKWMLDFIAFAEEKFGDRITAYILSGGGTSEWYEYDKGISSRVKNNAWKEWCNNNSLSLGADAPQEGQLVQASHDDIIYDPETELGKIKYWQFHNEIIADAILHFTKEARQHISNSKEIGVFYGYYLVGGKIMVSFGHLDYERVFASPDIDFFISPGNYQDRQMGGGSGSQLVFGTASRYGKRYLHEMDHRTHTTNNIGSKWETQEEDNAGTKREIFFSLINHASSWYFDMWGGFYQTEEIRDLIRHLNIVFEKYKNDKSPSVAEALLIADPQSAYYINEKNPQALNMSGAFRNKLNKTGVPFDVYSFNDIPEIEMSRYKVIFLPYTFLITPERGELLKKYVLNNDRTIVWTYAPGICNGKNLDTERIKKWTGTDYGTTGPTLVDMGGWNSVYAYDYVTMTSAAIKNIMTNAGVHQYTNEENPVYANERLLSIHFKQGGRKKITLPKVYTKVIDVMTEKVVAENSSEFLYDFKSPDTVLFEVIK